MWFDSLKPDSPWSSLWHDYVICHCGGIRRTEGDCPACGQPLEVQPPMIVKKNDGIEVAIHMNTQMGAEGNYFSYMYLDMLEREWKRPVTDADRVHSFGSSPPPSQRASIVIQFWSYFEARIERLLTESMRKLPTRVREDLLNRYSGITHRIDRLYRILFDTSYWADLSSAGFPAVAQHLVNLQRQRNEFAHGNPHAIDDALVEAVVENLKAEHESWIAVYNFRAAKV